ncbi:hypothetical protein PTW32_04830 [Dechloromonas agitata]|uniref:Uncharacterized protein n=1 Tax=Dechloromonas agitata TaxID=73030 RepID=A0A930BVP7_9RHOO|nr:hypothetical protein [Dechloromonas agitata]MBF1164620.1 hypothetical protein [Dechloromonas agitata]MDE1544735.1 hypothetical protein [Dechloromonas agitata]
MLNPGIRPPRPRLTGRIAAYALADVFGLTCVGIGGSWFADGKGAILANFPSSLAEAVACVAGGVAVMIWAVARILREINRQAPEMQARYAAYLAAQHPDRIPPKGDGQ